MHRDDAMDNHGALNHGGMDNGDMNHDDGGDGGRNRGDMNHAAGMMIVGFAGHVLRQGVGLLKWVGDAIGAPIDEDGQQQQQQQQQRGGGQGQGQAEAEAEAEARLGVAAAAEMPHEEELLLIELPPLVGAGAGLGPGNARRVAVRVLERGEIPAGVPRVRVGEGIVGVARGGMAPRSLLVFAFCLALAFIAGVGVGWCGGGATATRADGGSAMPQSRYGAAVAFYDIHATMYRPKYRDRVD